MIELGLYPPLEMVWQAFQIAVVWFILCTIGRGLE